MTASSHPHRQKSAGRDTLHPTSKVNRFFYRIWFIGAGVWFFDAVLSMHHRFLARGLAQAALAAAFLVLGMLFRQRYRQEQRRKQQRDADQQPPRGNGGN